MSRPAAERREDLVALYKEVRTCTRCPLHETRTQAVFGNGNADADLMFVGEAPGMHEDQQGLPFVGRAGQLLDELLREVGLSREEVFVCNVLKSRPPGNRDPEPAEILACRPYLDAQVDLIEPRVICTLGNFATKLLTRSQRGITSVRGRPQEHQIGGRPVRIYPLFHPAAALRTPKVKEQLRDDFSRLPALLAEPLPGEEAPRKEPPPQEEPRVDQLGLFG
jgi:DNA polymerase